METRKKIGGTLVLLLIGLCSCSMKTLSSEFSSDWEKIKPLLIEKAEELHGCYWGLEREHVVNVELGDAENAVKAGSCPNAKSYLINFSTYCYGRQNDAYVVSEVTECGGNFKVRSLQVIE